MRRKYLTIHVSSCIGYDARRGRKICKADDRGQIRTDLKVAANLQIA